MICPVCQKEMKQLDFKYYTDFESGLCCDEGIHFSIYYDDDKIWRVSVNFNGKNNEIGMDYGDTCYVGIGESFTIIPVVEFQDSWQILLKYLKLKVFL